MPRSLRSLIIPVLIVTFGLAFGFIFGRAGRTVAAPAAPDITASGADARAFAEGIGALLDRLEVRPAVVMGNLAVYPVILTGDAPKVDYLTLQEALKSGALVITEEGQGTVPSLRAKAKTDRPIFLMAGEVIVGARQDRVLAHDIIIEPGARDFTIPVYCVEPHRWASVSDSFADAGFAANQSVRQAVVQKGSQGKVWQNVGEVNAASGKDAGGSLRQGYDDEQLKKERDKFLAALKNVPGPGVVGAVVAINGKFVNADVFATPGLFVKLWPKLSEAYAMDAMQAKKASAAPKSPAPKVAREFLVSILNADYREYNNPGSGAEFEVKGKNKAGSVILSGNAPVHLAIFPEDKTPAAPAPAGMHPNPPATMHGMTATGEALLPGPINQQRENSPEQVQQQLRALNHDDGQRPDIYKDKGREFHIKKKPD